VNQRDVFAGVALVKPLLCALLHASLINREIAASTSFVPKEHRTDPAHDCASMSASCTTTGDRVGFGTSASFVHLAEHQALHAEPAAARREAEFCV
jgi:hypothetical protein